MLIRNTLIVAGASFALSVACFAGVAALAGPEIMKNGWTFPLEHGDTIVVRENGKVIHGNHSFTVRGQPSAPSVDRTFAWTGKDELQIDLPVDVVFVQGAEAKVVASGPKAYLDRLRVEGGHIFLADGDDGDHDSVTINAFGVHVESDSDRVKITVIAPDVTKFDLRGSGDLSIRRYDHPTFAVQVSGSSDVEADGRTEAIAIDNSGSGYVNLASLKGQDAVADISGSGGGALFARGKVKVDISGSGDIDLKTEPKSISTETSGSGEVNRDF